MEIALVNPRRRRKAKRRSKKAHRSPRRRRRAARVMAKVAPRRRRGARKVRRYRARGFKRNPIGGLSTSGIIGSVKEGVIAASGAVALDVVMGMLPLPDTLKAGPVGVATKAAGAIGLGFLAGKFLGRATGAAVAQGALTVIAYNVLKGQLVRFAPQLAMGEYVNGLGEYVNGLGYLNPAPVIGYDAGNSGFGADLGSSMPIAVNVGPSGFGAYDDGGDDPFGLNG